MFRRYALAVLLIAVTGSSGYAQLPFSRDALPTRTALARLGLEKNWSGVVPLAGPAERVLMISLSESMVFAQTNLANFHAYDAETGRYLWGMDLGSPTADAQPATVNSDRVFVTNIKDLYCLDKGTGRIIWDAKMENLPSSAVAANEEIVVVGMRSARMTGVRPGAGSGRIEAFSVRDHSQDNPPGRSAGSFLWAYSPNGSVTGRPIVADRVVAFGSHDHRVYVGVMMNQPTLLYRYLTGGPVSASMGTLTFTHNGEHVLLVPSEDNNLYAIDLFTGDTRWVFPSGAPIKQEPLVAGLNVFVINDQGSLSAIDGETGELRWTNRIGESHLLALGDSRVYLKTTDGDLMIVDRQSGRTLADARSTRERAGLSLREFTITPTNWANDRLYMATPSGSLVCLREAGATQPKPLRQKSPHPFGYIPPEGIQTPPEPPPAEDEGLPAEEPEGALFP